MRDPGRRVELGVNAVPAPGGHDAAATGPRMLLNDAAEVAERRAGLDELYRLVEALPRRFDHLYRVRICPCAVTHVVRLVKIRVVAAVVDGDVEVDDVTVQEDALVGYPMADDLVRGRAQGLWEVVVVQGRGIRLPVVRKMISMPNISPPGAEIGLTSRSTQALWQISSR